MKNKGLETYLYSTLGVLAMFVIVLAVNLIAARLKTRVDLTAEHAYTLSQGTRNILAKLDTPVQIRFYCTRGENRMPVPLKTYAQRVEDLLGEYRQASKGQIEVIKLDPTPDSDAEDSAKLDGVEGQAADENGELIYLGVSVSMLDKKEVISFLLPNRERLLEYDLSRAISRVTTPKKPVVGLLSPLPVVGQQMSPMMMQMGRRGQPAWVLYTELQRDFDVKTIETTADTIPDDVKVLVVIHPKGVSPATQYAIDQFVLRGGKLIAFLDPMAALDPSAAQTGGASNSSLELLLKAWGLEFNDTKVVADLNYMGRTRQGRAPSVLALTDQAMNGDDIITAQADNLFMVFAGAFAGTPTAGLKETVLIKTSKDSELIDPSAAQGPGDTVVNSFVASGVEYPLAVRLTGKFKTAFPKGKPGAADAKPGDKKEEDKSLKESAQENSVVLIGDSDLIQDQVSVQEMQNPFGGGQRMVMPANGNLAFAQGAIEQMTGDDNLISVRSRASRERPFTVVKKMQNAAESNYRSKIKELETSLSEAQTKLTELQNVKGDKTGGKFILSPEQQQEIANFRKKETDVKQQLKAERKKLRTDIDSLENRIKWLNIAGMPVAVTFLGLGLALVSRKRRAAR
jgi:ABC-type uncharacterized transport system involved in gliding motility auxiliary subunit